MEKEIQQLQNIFDLNKSEAKIYLESLNFDAVNLTDLSKKSGIPRTACYNHIKNLLKKRFLATIKIKKRTYYRGVEPDKLKYILDRKQLELADVVSSLKKQIDIPERKLAITYFYGRSGIEMAADIFLEEGRAKKAKSWEATEANIRESGISQLQNYINRRVEKGILGEMIVAGDPNDKMLKNILSRDYTELRESIIVNPKKYPFNSAIAVFDDMVLIITFGDNPFAVLIKNKNIASTFWSIHEMYWDRYKK